MVFGVVAGLAAAGFAIYFTQLETGAIDDSLTAQAQTLAAGVDNSNGTVTFQGGDALPGLTSQGIAVDALLTNGTTTLDSSGTAPAPAAVASVVQAALRTPDPVFSSMSIGGVQQRVRAQRLSGGDAANVVLVVSRSMAEEQSTITRTELLLLGTVVALTVVASLLGYLLAGRALRPVREIATTAREISERDLHRRIELSLPPDELGELAATFNEMLSRLEASFTSLQRFTADAAHELRAPLAVMLADVQVSLRQGRTPEEYRQTLATVSGEVEGLSRLADHLLVLARADVGALGALRENVDLPDFLEERVAQWRPLIAGRGLTVVTDLPGAGSLPADVELLRRLVDNLLDNAVTHTPRGGTISVIAARDGGWWRIEVADTGPGIPEPLRDRVFERFTRGDPARGRDGGGAGLGLALAAAVAQAHGGSIALGEGPGARLVVRLPAEDGVGVRA